MILILYLTLLSAAVLYLFSVDDNGQDAPDLPLGPHQALLHVVPGLGQRLPIAGEVSLVTVNHGAVQDSRPRLDHIAAVKFNHSMKLSTEDCALDCTLPVHGMLPELRQQIV